MSHTDKRAQSAVEFLIFMGVVFAGVIVVIAISYAHMTSLQNEKQYRMVRERAAILQSELVLASQVEDGYRRSIEVPFLLEYASYEIDVRNNTLTISTDKATYSVRIPFVNGTIAKGITNISRENGTVYLR